MYELNRVMLRNFGPTDARYENVTLDFSEVGRPVKQQSLITQDGYTDRCPSGASLLLLQNGGGKGVLLSAIMSTVVPYRYRDPESLREFIVSQRQPTHVVLEWVDSRDGRLLVTGQLVAPDSKGAPQRYFYSFRPGPVLTADTLPFTRDGKWVSLSEYQGHMQTWRSQHDSLEMYFDSGLEAWEYQQTAIGLMPDLFAIQLRMNSTEGGAANAFETNDSAKFVEWLLRNTAPDDGFNNLSTEFDSYSNNIAQHDKWRLENQYANAMQQECELVNERRAECLSADNNLRDASKRLGRHTAAVAAKEQILTTQCETATEKLTTVRKQHSEAEKSQTAASNRQAFVNLCALKLDHQSKKEQLSSAEQASAQATKDLDAWKHVGLALRYNAAVDDNDNLQKILEEAQAEAAPLLQARNRAGAQLKQAYTQAAEEAQEAADNADQSASDTHAQTSEWDSHIGEGQQACGKLEGEQEQLRKQIQTYETHLATAGADGALEDSEDPAGAATRLTEREAQLKSQAELARSTFKEAREDAKTTTNTATTAERTAAAEAARHNEYERGIDALRARAVPIVANPLTGQLVEIDQEDLEGTDPLVWLDEHRGSVLEAISRSLDSARLRLAELEQQTRADEALLAVLDTSQGLLPARDDVTQVCQILASNNIPAFAGWQWMRDNIPPSSYLEAISQHPDLVDGVIVTDDVAVDTARTVLESANPLPRGAIAVASGRRLLAMAGEAARDCIVVNPNPAMYDEDAAATEREIVSARLASRQPDIDALKQRIEALQSLNMQFQHWCDEIGTTSVAERLTTFGDLAQKSNEAATSATKARATAAEAEEKAAKAEDAVARLVEEHTTISISATAMRQLAEEQDSAATAEVNLTSIADKAQAHKERIKQLQDKIKSAKSDIDRLVRQASTQRIQATSYRTKASQVTTSSDAIEATSNETEPQQPLPILAQRYEQAQSNLRAVEADENLQQRAKEAAETLRHRAAEWSDVDTAIQEAAQALLSDSRAVDEAQRQTVQRQLTDEVNTWSERSREYRANLAKLEQRIDDAMPRGRGQWIDDTEALKWSPTDSDHAEQLMTLANQELTQARLRCNETVKQLRTAETEHRHLEQKLAAFLPIAARLNAMTMDIPTHEPEPPYEGTADDADKLATELIATFNKLRQAADSSERRLRQAVERLRTTNGNTIYQSIKHSMRDQISSLDASLIPNHAKDWAAGFASRQVTLQYDLKNADELRDIIVGQLVSFVYDDCFSKLHQANLLSMIPDGPSPWAKRRFLTIKFDAPERTAITGLVRNAVDTMARSKRQRALSGIDIVMRCVRAAVPGGFSVNVLKPNPTGQTKMEPIERMEKVFSGGQELTGAILLYCMLAVLHSSPNPRARTRHGGTLFLDNPIGRANAEYLLELQFGFAEAMGIQLIYTTPLAEDPVITRFPLRIHLHNDSEAREGQTLIRVPAQARQLLVPRPIDTDSNTKAPTGMLNAARLYTKDKDQ